ncbi:Unknown protein, partial [Striga hermonthica]
NTKTIVCRYEVTVILKNLNPNLEFHNWIMKCDERRHNHEPAEYAEGHRQMSCLSVGAKKNLFDRWFFLKLRRKTYCWLLNNQFHRTTVTSEKLTTIRQSSKGPHLGKGIVVYSPPAVDAAQPLRATPITAVRVTRPSAAAADPFGEMPSRIPVVHMVDLGSSQSDDGDKAVPGGATSYNDSDVDPGLVEETLRGDISGRERVPMGLGDAETDAAVEAATSAPPGSWR